MSLLFLPSCRECWQGIYMGKRELEMLQGTGEIHAYTHTITTTTTTTTPHVTWTKEAL